MSLPCASLFLVRRSELAVSLNRRGLYANSKEGCRLKRRRYECNAGNRDRLLGNLQGRRLASASRPATARGRFGKVQPGSPAAVGKRDLTLGRRFRVKNCRAEGRGATLKPLRRWRGVYCSDNTATFANLYGRSRVVSWVKADLGSRWLRA